MFLHLSVILFTEGGGVSIPQCNGTGGASREPFQERDASNGVHWEMHPGGAFKG